MSTNPNTCNGKFFGGERYNQLINEATAFVSHAGMGNIISARGQQTPIIVINRQYELGEHRNNHQADGLLWMSKLPGVYTASTKEALFDQLNARQNLVCPTESDNQNRQRLVQFLGDYVDGSVT